MPRRRFWLSLLPCLLALLTASGSVVPPPALWQCRHAARLVLTPLADKPAAMPCRMTGKAMPTPMACCRVSLSAPAPAASLPQTLLPPPCRPTLTVLTAAPALHARLRAPQMACPLRVVPLSCLPFVPAARVSSVPISLRQRPPPGACFLSAALSRPSLRAPPAA